MQHHQLIDRRINLRIAFRGWQIRRFSAKKLVYNANFPPEYSSSDPDIPAYLNHQGLPIGRDGYSKDRTLCDIRHHQLYYDKLGRTWRSTNIYQYKQGDL